MCDEKIVMQERGKTKERGDEGEKVLVDQIVCGGVGIQISSFCISKALLLRMQRMKYCWNITLSLAIKWHEAVQRV